MASGHGRNIKQDEITDLDFYRCPGCDAVAGNIGSCPLSCLHPVFAVVDCSFCAGNQKPTDWKQRDSFILLHGHAVCHGAGWIAS